MGRRVVIVGSGVAAALLAQGLLDRDPSIESATLLEAGGAVDERNRRTWLDFVTTGALPWPDHGDRIGDSESSPTRVELAGSRLLVRGGTTGHWGGWALRFKPEDFHLHSAAGREVDWPFAYDELEPYYAAAEQALGICGDSGDDVPPRKGRRYPFEAPPFSQADGLVIAGLEKRGLSYAHLPIARAANRCITTGTCQYCPVGARYTATRTLDRLAATHGRSGRFELRLGSAVRSLAMDGAARARGVEYVDVASGRSRRLTGDVVIVAAGAIESPKLLLACRGEAWPRGLGNGSGHVGRHLKVHPLLSVEACLPANPSRIHQELDFPLLCSRHYDSEAQQRDGKLFFVRSVSSPDAGIEAMMAAGQPLAAVEAVTRGPLRLTFNGFVEQFSSEGNRVEAAPGFTRFGLPRTRIRYTLPNPEAMAARHLRALEEIFRSIGATVVGSGVLPPRADHAASTARMSRSAADGAVDPHLKVHGTDNVYVCSTAVFPTIAAVNPTLTLAALALRLVEDLVAPG